MGNDRFNAKVRKGRRKVRKEESFAFLRDDLCVPLRLRSFMNRHLVLSLILILGAVTASAQTRRRAPAPKPSTQAPRGSAAKYSAFMHSSDKHQALACNACHKVPTEWTAKRDFPDVADFPNHDACVRCHRQQFFTRQSVVGTGPAICTVCHVRAAPREGARFVFGKPNPAAQATKPKDERQFTIEFPHDKHQNVIASVRPGPGSEMGGSFIRASFFQRMADDQKVPDYNNCTICHQRNDALVIAPLSGPPDAAAAPANKFFKTVPHAHDSCFNCHWKNQKPAGDDCAGCHKPAPTFVAMLAPKRISAMFSHEGGKGAHENECTTCHINITRAVTLRGLTADVPVAACVTCHKDSKKTTYPKITSIEDELAQFKRTSSCSYCHQIDVGKKNPPPGHAAAAQ
jgi:cytochrome c553